MSVPNTDFTHGVLKRRIEEIDVSVGIIPLAIRHLRDVYIKIPNDSAVPNTAPGKVHMDY